MLAVEKAPPTERRIASSVEELLAETLPNGWSLRSDSDAKVERFRVDLLIEVTSPSGQTADLAIEIKRMMEPRLVDAAANQISMLAAELGPTAVPVVAADYLSPRSRKLLEDRGVGYVDTTGNVRLTVPTPGLFISAIGAERDPWPRESSLQSIGGPGASRALRALVDSSPPFGVRELAGSTSASAPTISRVLELLEREGIAKRESRGPVLSLDWQAAIRRWAEDYEQMGSNAAIAFLEPRGIPELEKKLSRADLIYAATGAFAAQRFDPIAPARIATLYVDDVTEAARRLHLREADAGTNVVLLEPFDQVVFEGVTSRDGLQCVAPSQLAVDLLTGPGREPSQGEEMLRWMEENQDAWRS